MHVPRQCSWVLLGESSFSTRLTYFLKVAHHAQQEQSISYALLLQSFVDDLRQVKDRLVFMIIFVKLLKFLVNPLCNEDSRWERKIKGDGGVFAGNSYSVLDSHAAHIRGLLFMSLPCGPDCFVKKTGLVPLLWEVSSSSNQLILTRWWKIQHERFKRFREDAHWSFHSQQPRDFHQRVPNELKTKLSSGLFT